MSLLDDLKDQHKDAEKLVEELNLRRLQVSRDISITLAHARDLSIAIAALEPAPIPPLSQDYEATASARVDGPEIPEGFTKWEGGKCPVADGVLVETIWRGGRLSSNCEDIPARHAWNWEHGFDPSAPGLDVIAYRYRIISEPSADGEETLKADPLPGFDEADAESDALGDDPGDVNGEHISVLNDPELIAAVDRASASIARDEPEYDITSGDQALMFGHGILTDAERNAEESRSIVDKLTGMFKREREDA